MRQQRTYRCSVCGADIPDLPVLRHQLSHVERRIRAVDRSDTDAPSAEDQHRQP
jgi:hypothetical protein